jgi:hypothetical protein
MKKGKAKEYFWRCMLALIMQIMIMIGVEISYKNIEIID